MTLKLVRLIERHSEELVGGLTEQLHLSERTSDFRKIPAAELEPAAAEVYRNLGEWLLQKTDEDIESVDFAQPAHVGRPRESPCISLCGP